MPTPSNRAKKALQEISKVFKVASRLTADITKAVRELETLQREVQRLRTTSSKATGSAKSSHRKSGNRTTSPTKTRSTGGHAERSHARGEIPSHEASDFVFPKEPFNPPTPPEPSPSGNN